MKVINNSLLSFSDPLREEVKDNSASLSVNI